MVSRQLREWGLHPVLGYLLFTGIFVGSSRLLYSKTEFAPYVLLAVAFSFLTKLTNRPRLDFMRFWYQKSTFRAIRLIENSLVALPFSVLYIFTKQFYPLGILVASLLVLAGSEANLNINFTLPTPFKKRLFEFTVGFRKTFLLFPLAYFLAVMAAVANNPNLGIFALALIFLVCISFYSDAEPEYFVWSFATTPAEFLLSKIKTASLYAALTALPPAIGLFVFYPAEALAILTVIFVGLIFLITIVFAKYSAYPNEVNIPEGILLVVGLVFPPFLLFLLPFFYRKAIKKLQPYLA